MLFLLAPNISVKSKLSSAISLFRSLLEVLNIAGSWRNNLGQPPIFYSIALLDYSLAFLTPLCSSSYWFAQYFLNLKHSISTFLLTNKYLIFSWDAFTHLLYKIVCSQTCNFLDSHLYCGSNLPFSHTHIKHSLYNMALPSYTYDKSIQINYFVAIAWIDSHYNASLHSIT
jgi:hypothetical protein